MHDSLNVKYLLISHVCKDNPKKKVNNINSNKSKSNKNKTKVSNATAELLTL